VASIDKRIEALEAAYAGPERGGPPGDLEGRRAELKALLAVGEVKAAAEEAAGDNRQRLALENLKRRYGA
jgi:hypothetical protein